MDCFSGGAADVPSSLTEQAIHPRSTLFVVRRAGRQAISDQTIRRVALSPSFYRSQPLEIADFEKEWLQVAGNSSLVGRGVIRVPEIASLATKMRILLTLNPWISTWDDLAYGWVELSIPIKSNPASKPLI